MGVVAGPIQLHGRNEVPAAGKHSTPHINVLWPGGWGPKGFTWHLPHTYLWGTSPSHSGIRSNHVGWQACGPESAEDRKKGLCNHGSYQKLVGLQSLARREEGHLTGIQKDP